MRNEGNPMPIGVIVNCISVLAGGVIGSALGHVLPNSLKEHLPTLFGMCSIAIGINSIIKAVSMTAVVLAILVGFTIGHLLHLEDWASRFFHRLVKTMHLGGDNIDMEFYITAVALFCCSGFGWYSTLTEGIAGDPNLLFAKSVLDFFTAMIFASTLGKATCAIPLPQCVILLMRVYRRTAAVRCAHTGNVRGFVRVRRRADYVGRFSCLQDQIRAAGRSHACADTRYAVQRTLDYVDGVNLKRTLLRVCFSFT